MFVDPFMCMGTLIITFGQIFFVYKGTRSQIERVEFVSDNISCINLSGHWCDIILNVLAPTENKSDDTLHESRECIPSISEVSHNFLWEYFVTKVGTEDIFKKPSVGNENLHEISNNNGIIVVNTLWWEDAQLKVIKIIVYIVF
jgi:hypothetical protein